jgi:glycosidase
VQQVVAHLGDFSRAVHERGMRLVLDGVFNHTGRDFWAFRDLRQKGAQSPFAGWYHVDWKRRGAFGERSASHGQLIARLESSLGNMR